MRVWWVAAALLLASCGATSQQPTTATATPSALAAAGAITEIANRVFPLASAQSHPPAYPGSVDYVECEFARGVDFEFSNCPITARFLARLLQNPSAMGRSRAFCRCQNTLPMRTVTADPASSGGVAHINLGNATIDLILKVEGGRLLVDDTQCPGKGSKTSYYLDPVAACT